MPRSREGLARLIEREGVSPRVAAAFRAIDRIGFVPGPERADAYRDRPIGLPEGQTTSQPSLIARMIDAAEVGPGDRVLEVGTGYGFQTALLAKIASWVFSIERHPPLAEGARARLARAGIENVSVVIGDGWRGIPEEAPFDAIVVSAAAPELPAALGAQLSVGGRLVIPLTTGQSDDVILFRRTGTELVRVRLVTPARFVPLVRGDPDPPDGSNR